MFVFVDGTHHKCYKETLNRGRSYTEPPTWTNDKKSTINPQNNYDNAIKVALNHDSTGKNPQRITRIRPSMDQYEWKDKFSHRTK